MTVRAAALALALLGAAANAAGQSLLEAAEAGDREAALAALKAAATSMRAARTARRR